MWSPCRLLRLSVPDAISSTNPRVIDDSRARKLSSDLKRCTYYETCATYGLNVERVFQDGEYPPCTPRCFPQGRPASTRGGALYRVGTGGESEPRIPGMPFRAAPGGTFGGWDKTPPLKQPHSRFRVTHRPRCVRDEMLLKLLFVHNFYSDTTSTL